MIVLAPGIAAVLAIPVYMLELEATDNNTTEPLYTEDKIKSPGNPTKAFGVPYAS